MPSPPVAVDTDLCRLDTPFSMAIQTLYSEARQHPAAILDRAGDDRYTIVITRLAHWPGPVSAVFRNSRTARPGTGGSRAECRRHPGPRRRCARRPAARGRDCHLFVTRLNHPEQLDTESQVRLQPSPLQLIAARSAAYLSCMMIYNIVDCNVCHKRGGQRRFASRVGLTRCSASSLLSRGDRYPICSTDSPSKHAGGRSSHNTTLEWQSCSRIPRSDGSGKMTSICPRPAQPGDHRHNVLFL